MRTLLRVCRPVLAGLSLLLLVPAVAFAQPAQPVQRAAKRQVAPAKAPANRYQQVTKHDFEEHVVDGGRAVPLGDYFGGKPGTKHSSLISVRTHFVPEMIRSAEDL